MVRMASVSKDKLPTCSLYGEDDKARVSIRGCKSTVHVNCYLKRMNESNNFRTYCSLCSTDHDCILPTQFDPDDSFIVELSSNSITLNLGTRHQVLNSDSLLMLIFKHLVNSKGLNNLLMLEKPERKRLMERRLNKRLETLMLEIFHNSKSEEQEKYMVEIRKMMGSIYPCRNQLLGDLQMLLASALLSKI